MVEIRITVDGHDVLTIGLAAAAHGLSHRAMRAILDRAGAQPVVDETGEPVRIGRQPLYAPAAVRAALSDRPGRGAPGVPRPHRAGPVAG